MSTLVAADDEAKVITSDFAFQEDVSVSSGHGIIIGADDITIDGNGYVLDGTDPGLCEGGVVNHCGIINIGYDNVTIKNLEIINFCSGIYLSYDSSSGDIVHNNTIESCHVHHNGNSGAEWTESHGIKLIGVSDSTVINCTVYDNHGAGNGCEDGGNGIFLMGTSSGDGGKRNRISFNVIFNNSKGGFFTKMKPEHTIVDNNTIYGNGQGGIILRCKKSSSHLIEHNVITDNFGCGIFVGGNNNSIKDNEIVNNKNGSIYWGIVGEYGTGVDFGRNDGSSNNLLVNNIICGNQGVDVEAFNGNERTGNHGYGNTGLTAINYHDDQPCQTSNFTYTCTSFSGNENVKDDSINQSTIEQNNNTGGFEVLLLLLGMVVLVFFKKNKS
jgi:hypothetical protein